MKIKDEVLKVIERDYSMRTDLISIICIQSECDHQTAKRWLTNNTRELLIYNNLISILQVYEMLIRYTIPKDKRGLLEVKDIIEVEDKDRRATSFLLRK